MLNAIIALFLISTASADIGQAVNVYSGVTTYADCDHRVSLSNRQATSVLVAETNVEAFLKFAEFGVFDLNNLPQERLAIQQCLVLNTRIRDGLDASEDVLFQEMSSLPEDSVQYRTLEFRLEHVRHLSVPYAKDFVVLGFVGGMLSKFSIEASRQRLEEMGLILP
jgi:hypothetical protein